MHIFIIKNSRILIYFNEKSIIIITELLIKQFANSKHSIINEAIYNKSKNKTNFICNLFIFIMFNIILYRQNTILMYYNISLVKHINVKK